MVQHKERHIRKTTVRPKKRGKEYFIWCDESDRRGKRTLAKEKLYKHINKKIRQIVPGFNIGANSGISEKTDYWDHPYRHWNFKPNEYEIDAELFK